MLRGIFANHLRTSKILLIQVATEEDEKEDEAGDGHDDDGTTVAT